MKLDEIMKLWDQDSRINKEDPGTDALLTSEKHNKYYKIFINENLVLRKYQAELKKLKLEKQEFYLMGPTEDQHAKGWRLPPCGKPLRSDLQLYLEADPDLIDLSLKIGLQNEKVDYLKAILDNLNRRNFLIKSHIDWVKIQNGII